ncbi:MAG: hypothetical protein ABSF69_15495 [Polyangiaceae bacterium]|jgi:hypothetical protein
MNHRFGSSKVSFALGALGLGLALSGEATAQPLPPEAPPPPPPAFVATVEPVYYEGHAAYWYGAHWYWRDPHGWHWYANEPAFLRDRRGHSPAPRHHYERRR